MLASRAVAYLNVDCAVSGPGFHASATLQLDELLKQASLQIKDPDNSSQSLYDSWVGSSKSTPIGRLGGKGSNFAAFVQHVGILAMDMYFGGGIKFSASSTMHVFCLVQIVAFAFHMKSHGGIAWKETGH
ncbi:Lysosome-associated membrane glycoprotein 1 [Ancistrocladus abbreviatus]